jgi:hypothetical protein
MLSFRAELKTSRLLNGCSNQLSYESLLFEFLWSDLYNTQPKRTPNAPFLPRSSSFAACMVHVAPYYTTLVVEFHEPYACDDEMITY